VARRIPDSHVGERVLGSAVLDESWLTYESRTPRFLGPQGACHPDDLELSVVLGGAALMRVGGREVVVRDRHYAVVGPGVEHSSWTRGAPAVELNVHLSRPLLERAMETLRSPAPGARVDRWSWAREARVMPPELDGVARALVIEATRTPPTALAVEALTHYLTAFLLRHHQLDAGRRVERLGDGVERRLARSVELMRAAYERALSLDQLAAAAEMGRFRYVHAFKQRYGLPPYAYLTRLRVEAAAMRIEATDAPITRVAFDVGFGSSSRLAEAFKRRFGVTPSRWRAARRKNRP
jgi:AraC-like DNA-binding protein